MQPTHNTLFDLPPVIDNREVKVIVKRKKQDSYKYVYQGSIDQSKLLEIIDLVCNYYEIDFAKVCEHTLHPAHEVALARRLISYLWTTTRSEHSVSHKALMGAWGLSNHTSLVKGSKKAFTQVGCDKMYRSDVRNFETCLIIKTETVIEYPLQVNSIKYRSKVYGKETIYPETTCKDKLELAKLINNKVPIDVKQLIINNKITITL
jgi:hypothetical protein